MRGAMWMALALLGTTPLVTLAQQQGTGGITQPAAGPTGAASINQGQDSVGAPGSFGVFGQPTGSGLDGRGMMAPSATDATGTGGSGVTSPGMSSQIGPTYRGTTSEIPSAAPFMDTNSQTTAAAGTAPNAPPATGNPQADVAALQQRVDALEREVSSLRGTGGSGTAGTAETAGTARTAAPGNSAPVTVVTVEFEGTVRDVSPKHIDVIDRTDGTLSRLAIDDETRVFKGSPRKRIAVKNLTEGTRVRTSFAYIAGAEHARDIVVQPAPSKSRK